MELSRVYEARCVQELVSQWSARVLTRQQRAVVGAKR